MSLRENNTLLISATRLSRMFRANYWIALLGIAVLWQGVLTILGYALGDGAELLDHTMGWDGGWYVSILNGGYWDNSFTPVFYPLFPFVVWLVHEGTFHLFSLPVVGIIINTIALWLALVALYKVTDYIVGAARAVSLALFLAFPSAFFMHMFYSEALFCALAFWAYYFALRGRWYVVVILLAFLTASRLPAVLFILLCVLEFVRQHQWGFKKTFLDLRWLLFLIAPLGLVAYALFLHTIRGDGLAMVHAYEGSVWTYHVLNLNIFATIGQTISNVGSFFFGHTVQHVNNTFPLFTLGVLGATSLYAFFIKAKQRIFLPLGVFGLAAIIMFTLNSNVVSVHRYILPCIVTYLVLAYAYNRFLWVKSFVPLFTILCVLGQALLFTLFVSGRFAG